MGAAARTPAFTGVLMLSPPREHEHFMQKHVPEAILALASWTIKRDGGKFVVRRRPHSRSARSKPYDTLQAATNAVARKLQEEWLKRHKRRREFHGVK